MSEVTELTNEKLVEKLIGSWAISIIDAGPIPPLEKRQRASAAHKELRAELLRRLSSQGAGPRCPKCKSDNLGEIKQKDNAGYGNSSYIDCMDCKAEFWLVEMEDAAQFFRAPSDLPRLETCNFAIGQTVKWQGQEGECRGIVKRITLPENSDYVLWLDIGCDEDFPHGVNDIEAVDEHGNGGKR